MTERLEEARRAVIRVGDGRGFVVEGERSRLVITAAHCLPEFPPCAAFSHLEERTYRDLLGSVGDEPSIWAECLFVDPIGDIAVLGPPDTQELYEQAEAYEELMQASAILPMADPAAGVATAWLLSLDGRWFQCEAQHRDSPLWLFKAVDGIVGGMSGSPILSDEGAAIGVLTSSGGGVDMAHTDDGPCPRLAYNLPGWLLRELAARRAA
jgi:hypothetical protein